VSALDVFEISTDIIAVNLGTGKPYSVLDIVNAFEEASGQKIPYEIVARREGDLAEYYADPTLAEKILGWKAKLDLSIMCKDVWRWNKYKND
jgi:UDP-glucose 4-epimerase